MSQTDFSQAAAPRRVLTFASLFGVAAVTTLISSQFVTVGGVFVYSLVVLLHLSQTIAIGLYGLFGALALWGFVIIVRLAYEAETAPENN
ncbi:hypothetical protein EJC49_00325 [Aquibium carbonis]|uniref:Uncharacterized protein n=1 Tax=Aquibium carbonis TaxID=2495581 RepID=A0A3S0ACE7_9HYPH|nr:hypothetical protein [Aquibium carbonis]RST88488.1 hypothetical protein EJC49_00325 [Aquibium carbonis]